MRKRHKVYITTDGTTRGVNVHIPSLDKQLFFFSREAALSFLELEVQDFDVQEGTPPQAPVGGSLGPPVPTPDGSQGGTPPQVPVGGSLGPPFPTPDGSQEGTPHDHKNG